MGKRNRVTTRDIAEELGISQSTVSMILSNKPNVSFTDETVQKVKAKQKSLDTKNLYQKNWYRKNLLQIQLSCYARWSQTAITR